MIRVILIYQGPQYLADLSVWSFFSGSRTTPDGWTFVGLYALANEREKKSHAARPLNLHCRLSFEFWDCTLFVVPVSIYLLSCLLPPACRFTTGYCDSLLLAGWCLLLFVSIARLDPLPSACKAPEWPPRPRFVLVLGLVRSRLFGYVKLFLDPSLLSIYQVVLA